MSPASTYLKTYVVVCELILFKSKTTAQNKNMRNQPLTDELLIILTVETIFSLSAQLLVMIDIFSQLKAEFCHWTALSLKYTLLVSSEIKTTQTCRKVQTLTPIVLPHIFCLITVDFFSVCGVD